ncbi:MAG: DMT family transporter [Aquabacterium sp.]|nr:DMT family transporter [Aquabacterium sp.]
MTAPGVQAAASRPLQALLLGTMAMWGANLSVVKLLLTQMEPILVSVLRMVVAAVAVAAVVAWRRLPWPALSRRQWWALAGCAVLMVYLNQILFTQGVAATAAANAALIIALNPLVSALLAAVLLGDRLSPQRIAGVVLGFGGVAAVVLHRPGMAMGGAGLGDLLVLGAVTTWVLGGVMVQRLARGIDPLFISAVLNVIGAVLLLLHVLVRPAPLVYDASQFGPLTVLLVLVSGLLATALGGIVWNRALMVLGVARTSLYSYWVPIFGVLFAVLLLGEPLTVWHGVGLAAVLAGTWLGTRSH